MIGAPSVTVSALAVCVLLIAGCSDTGTSTPTS